jgi:cytochrome bd-type quinol oxidase subunit 2
MGKLYAESGEFNLKMEEKSQNKKRHIIVTLFLILTILVDAYGVYSSFFGDESEIINNSNISSKAIMIIFGILGILDVFLISLILKWSKNAFWAICLTTIMTFFLNIFTGVGLTFSLIGLSGLFLFFGILQIKYNQKSAWENLE